jgi:cell division protein FtsW
MILIDIIAATLLAATGLGLLAAALGLGRAAAPTSRLVVWGLGAVACAAVLAGQLTAVTVLVPPLAWACVRERRQLAADRIRGPVFLGSLLLLGLGALYAERLGPELVVAGASASVLVAEVVALALLVAPRRRASAIEWASAKPLLAGGVGVYFVAFVFGRISGTFRTSLMVPAIGEVVVAEPARVVVLLGVGLWLSDRTASWRDLGRSPQRGTVVSPVLAAVVAATVIAYASGDLGGAMLSGLSIAAVIAVVVGRAWPLLVASSGLLFAGFVSTLLSVRADARVDAWLHPHLIERGEQQLVGLFAMAEGGWFGAGFGRGTQTWAIPQVESDYALAGLVHELGPAVVVAVLGAVVTIVVGACRVAAGSATMRSAAIAITVAVVIGLQALVNLLGITLTAPLTGVPFPFISRGGAFTITVAGLVRYVVAQPAVDPRWARGVDSLNPPLQRPKGSQRSVRGGSG